MKDKRFPPIIISILLLLAGVFVALKIYTDWKQDDFTLNNPIVTKAGEETRELDLKTIIHEAEKNVIQIEAHTEYKTVTGSGFLYNDKGDIITNAHVINDVEAIYVRTADARFYPAAVVGISDETDIAVIRVPQLAGERALSVSEEKAELGDEIIALGSPHGFQNTVTLGIISGSERDFVVDGYNYSNVYQISAQITHGNSGGPLIKRETGEIIGINSVGTDDGTIGFSIPLYEVIEQIETWSNEAQNDQLTFASVADMINREDAEQAEQDAVYMTEYFWDSLAIRDYVTAYTLLGSPLQLEASYTKFRDQYTNISDLQFDEINVEILENDRIKTTTDVKTEEQRNNNEEPKERNITYEFIFGYENDQLKILKLSSSKD